jgi:hypothetical protein
LDVDGCSAVPEIDDDGVGYRVSPSIAMDGLGKPFAAWQQSAGATNVWQVVGNRYE